MAIYLICFLTQLPKMVSNRKLTEGDTINLSKNTNRMILQKCSFKQSINQIKCFWKNTCFKSHLSHFY